MLAKLFALPKAPKAVKAQKTTMVLPGLQAAPTFTSDSNVTRSCTRYRVQKDTSLAAAQAAACAAASLIIRASDCV